MPSRLLAHLNEALTRCRPTRLAVAFSGGLDSTALLHALSGSAAATALDLRALHVNHGLHADAASWAAHCAEVCASLAVPLRVLDCEVSRDAGLGLEGAARQARYAALADALHADEWLVTAQHQDDQAETVLLRLLRASGTHGAAAMREIRPLGAGTLWRPLLGCSRADLLDYAATHHLRWIEDPANADSRHDRSWLRQHVMPLLRARWPHAAASLAASANLLAADADLVAALAKQALIGCAGADRSALDIDALLALQPTLRAHVLRLWLQDSGSDPIPARLLARVESELILAAEDTQPRLRYANTVICRYRRSLHALRADMPPAPTASIQWDGREALDLPDGGQLRIVQGWDGGPLRVGYREGGERIRLVAGGPRRALKHVVQEHAIPPWRRAHLPLLWRADGTLLAAGDRILAIEWMEAQRVTGCTLQWRQPHRRWDD